MTKCKECGEELKEYDRVLNTYICKCGNKQLVNSFIFNIKKEVK